MTDGKFHEYFNIVTDVNVPKICSVIVLVFEGWKCMGEMWGDCFRNGSSLSDISELYMIEKIGYIL